MSFIIERLLAWVNRRYGKKKSLPDELKDYFDEEKYAKMEAYRKERASFSLFSSTLSTGIMLVLLAFGGFGWLDSELRQVTQHYIWLPLLYFGVLGLSADLLSLPLQVYDTFILEERYGFNRTSTKTFFLDKVKGYLLGAIFGGAVLALLVWLVRELGNDFWWVFWIVITLFSLFMSFFYTSWLLPLFNQLSPLQAGSLRDKLEAYGRGIGYPLDKIFVVDGSKRSSRANAFFSGFGSRKKVVLYDTLIEGTSDEELVAVLAHEIGHYKKKHINNGIIMSVIQTGLILYLASLLIYNGTLSGALGAGQWSLHVNLIGFSVLLSPLTGILGLLSNYISRKNEFQADRFATSTYRAEPLGTALKKLATDNYENLHPHPVYVFCYYSHPPLLRRLRAINEAV
ncbi:M48 family metallopeptidase [Roseivirga sp. BDSF3-8]|uniref:M48 family metallopeptidase n=1 Tax=Roseivirga sp. BDSF3-8 TaxID=3241598 RepID=UPI0035321E65